MASLDVILALNDFSKANDVTLLCFEKSGIPCHRHLVRDIVENPALLGVRLETEDANDHEGVAIQSHVSNQETPIIVRLR